MKFLERVKIVNHPTKILNGRIGRIIKIYPNNYYDVLLVPTSAELHDELTYGIEPFLTRFVTSDRITNLF